MLLEATPENVPIIKKVCELEHESLIRLHTGRSVHSPEFAKRLADNGITLDDYMDYSSDAYYEFQKVLEKPDLIIHMPPLFFYVFTEICLYFKEELHEEFGNHFANFMEELANVTDVKPNLFSQN